MIRNKRSSKKVKQSIKRRLNSMLAEEQMEEEPYHQSQDAFSREEEAEEALEPQKITRKAAGSSLKDLPGVGSATAEKLIGSGFDTVMAIAVATPGELVDAVGVSEAVARKMISAARDCLEMGFESGTEVFKRRLQVQRISTGSPAFDALMGGGIETSALTECFGQYGSSKTQIAHQLAVNIQKDSEDAVAVYIDTENTFRPDRILQMAKGAGLDPEKTLNRVKVARAFNSDHQTLLAEKVEDLITKQGMNVRLVIVDSLTAHFRAEFIGRGTLADRQQKINKHMRTLSKLASVYNLAVYVTNQVMARPDQFFGDPTEAIGGHIVGHNSTFRIYLRKGKKGTRVAKLIDSPNLPDSECVFMITEDGVRDA